MLLDADKFKFNDASSIIPAIVSPLLKAKVDIILPELNQTI